MSLLCTTWGDVLEPAEGILRLREGLVEVQLSRC